LIEFIAINATKVSKFIKLALNCSFIVDVMYRWLWLYCWWIGICTLDAQIPFTCKGQYYLSLTRSNSLASELYEVKISADGQNINLETINDNMGLVVNGMGYRITDNFIYGIDPQTARLRKIGADGIAVDLGLPKGIPVDRLYYAGDVTPDGKYLIMIGLGGFPAQIAKIDLEDPAYSCTFVPLKDNNPGIVDVAFDPFTGILYGHDQYKQRMVTINPETGDINTAFQPQPKVGQIGALFFDSFGNLYGYGSYASSRQNKFLSIDKKGGKISLLAEGPNSSGQDGCACPYTLELQKIATPDTVFACTDVVYSFVISNGSGAMRTGIQLSDVMPSGFKIKSILKNPYGGIETFNDNAITIDNMSVPPGIDTIQVVVQVSDLPGKYLNQAVLDGLPLALGSSTFSDYPFSIIEKDSTPVVVLPVDLTFIQEEYTICKGDSVFVEADLYGVEFIWENGSHDRQRWLHAPGKYQLTASTDCEKKIVDISLHDASIEAMITVDTISINLGESVVLTSAINGHPSEVKYTWYSDTRKSEITCPHCAETEVTPYESSYFYLDVIDANGCLVTDSVYIRVKVERKVFAPNIISGNGDGVNETFYLSGGASIGEVLLMQIYDRWGNLVFENGHFDLNDPAEGWNGTFLGKPAETGVYTWIAQVRYLDDYEEFITGDITLIR